MAKNQTDGLEDLNEELKDAGETELPDPAAIGEKDSDDKDESDKSSKESDEESDSDEETGIIKDEEKEESKTDDDEESEDEEEESDDEEDDEPVESRHPSGKSLNRVETDFYTKYKEETSDLKNQRDYWKSKAESAEGKKPEPKESDDGFKQTVAGLASDLGLDEVKTEKFVNTILQLAEKRAVPKELMDRLATYEADAKKLTELQSVTAEREYFGNEWSEFLPTLQKEYPNASPEQLEEAREAMNIIAHSTKNKMFQMPLDYVYFKTKDEFKEILFSPKQKTFERGRTSMTANEGKEKGAFRIPTGAEQTPDSMDELEAALQELSDEDGNAQGLTARDAQGKKVHLRIE